MGDKFKVFHRDDLNKAVREIYEVEIIGEEYKVSWGDEDDFTYYTKYTVEDFVERGVWIITSDTKDVTDDKYKKLENDFITLEKNYESLWEENKKLKKQLEDKDKYIQRLNLEAQRWFDNCMDLMHPPKESE